MDLDRCRELDAGLRRPDRPKYEALRAWLDGFDAVEGCIAEGLRRCSVRADWLGFELYLLAAFQRPSRTYTAVLCVVLSRRDVDDLNYENIVDVLAEVRDPASVDCLKEALWWEPDWDEYRNLAVKCVWALAAIRTPEAVVAIREAAMCDAFKVREAAAHELKQLGG